MAADAGPAMNVLMMDDRSSTTYAVSPQIPILSPKLMARTEDGEDRGCQGSRATFPAVLIVETSAPA